MSQLPGYTLVERIHECPSTTVFRAKDAKGHHVVVKLATSPNPSPEELGRLRREYELGSRFDSPHIIRHLDLVPAGRGLALITEDFGANKLASKIPPNGMDLGVFLNIAIQLAEGLSHIHAGEVVHKDINVHNLVMNEKNKVKYIDFGISSRLSQEFQQEANPNKLEGTLLYISPEQTGRMNRPIDFRTDFYSLGVTFYEMLTGRPPFDSDDPLELIHSHIAKEAEPLEQVRADLPLVVGLILQKLMAKEAGSRYQSGYGLKVDLERCLRQWELGVKPGPFPLGREDFTEELHLSARLYGRERETRTLLAAFDRVAQGSKELLLIAGYAGIGKSVLVQEIYKPVTGRKGFFASGKFEQLAGNVAYSGIASAFGSLIDSLLSEREETILKWRKSLEDALGENGSLITSLIPQVSLIIGDQPPAPHLPPIENRVRFQMVFRDFVNVFANRSHPLVLFLDDLQWADPASLNLLDFLLSDRKTEHILVLGAFRDNEISQGDLLMLTLDKLQERGIATPMIHLEALNEDHLGAFLADTLRLAPETVKSLAHMVASKTNGNPFFTYELLKDLYRRKMLRFSKEEGRWVWDLEKISESAVSDNVVSFMVERMAELPDATRAALRVAACIGSSFDLKTLAYLRDSSPRAVAADLWVALKQGIVIPLHNNYRLIDQTLAREEDSLDLGVSYRFQHDRVQQAAYELLPPEERPQVHLRIGRAMLRGIDARQRREKAADIVSHFLAAADLIDTLEECQVTVELALIASRKALSAVAYQQALGILDAATQMMPGNAFDICYNLAFDVYSTAADAAYLSGSPSQAEAFCNVLLTQARSDLERAKVMDMQMVHYTTMKNMEKAIATGLRALSLLGVPIDPNPSRLKLLAMFGYVRLMMGRRPIEALADCPPIAQDHLITILDLLMRLALPVYYSGRSNFYAAVILKRVLLAVQHGNSPETANAFATFGLLLGGFLGRYREGSEFGKLALVLDKRYGVVELRTRVLFVYGISIHPWNHHWKTISVYLKRSMEAGCRSGDLLFLSMACSLVHHYDPTMGLETSLKEGEKYLSFLERVYYQGLGLQSKMFLQFRRCLMGRTTSRGSLNDRDFSEKACLDHLINTGNLAWMGLYYAMKLELAYTFDRFEEAEALIEQCRKYEGAMMGLPSVADFCLYSFLTQAALFDSADIGKQRVYRKEMKRDYRKMRKWAEHCPENFAHRLRMMDAELQRLHGDPWKACELYRLAIEEAAEVEYRKHEALANELAGRFFLSKAQSHVAASFLYEAEQRYHYWGAIAKVEAMRSRYGSELNLVDVTDDTSMISSTNSTSSLSITGTRTLDLNTVIKSSMAISSEIDYDRLLTKMMRITIESAGAQMGALISNDGPSMILETTIRLGDEDDVRHKGIALERANFLSQKVVRYAFRTGKTVVLGNAAKDPLFAKDPYLAESGVKSVLCTPIRHKDEVVGVLYLENNLVEDAFTEDRVELLQMLTAQAAISLENARLFAQSKRNELAVRQLNKELEYLNEELEQRVVDRTSELKRVQEELVAKAHHAGMAEIATSVLHNVGNILNSVITSCQLIHSTVTNSKLQGLLKANQMLRNKMDNIRDFIANDPKGINLLKYYLQFDKHLERERGAVTENVSRLMGKVESIRDVIMAQQSYASGGFQDEDLDLREVIDDALNILGSSIARHGIKVTRLYQDDVPKLMLPKNKLIHLIVNLVKNAVEAMTETTRSSELTIRVIISAPWLVVAFTDTGHGISECDKERIFQHGFTTKSQGHGFGLHSCANTMTEMGGSISAKSEGKGKGATFTLQFPLSRRVVVNASANLSAIG